MYKALYRQYRPTTFDDLVGQEAIAKTLQNAISQNKVAHAYLFSGPRGTGKTSVAKIFARELNGVSAEHANDEFSDIIEIDAASNNGVDATRDLIDSANYAPIELPFKVYIIDEVHMMSTSAFNALLKTIEEPPAQVKFILATTDPQKIPATILSRVQRFDFKRIPNELIVERLKYVLDDQGEKYEPEALTTIAQIADGGMRDALSILDQVYSISTDGMITNQSVLDITGRISTGKQKDILANAMSGNTAKALELFSNELAAGKDSVAMISDFIEMTKDAMLVNISPILISRDVQSVQELASEFSEDQLQVAAQLIGDTMMKIRTSMRPDVYAEVLLISLAKATQEHGQEPALYNNKSQVKPSAVSQPKLAEEVKEQPTAKANPVVHAYTENQTPHEQEITTIATETNKIEESVVENNEVSINDAASDSEVVDSDTPEPESEVEKTTNGEKQTINVNIKLAQDTQYVLDLLAGASKEELLSAKEAYEEIKLSGDVNFNSIAESAKVVAATPDALIINFELPQLLNVALADAQFSTKLFSEFSEVMGVDYDFVFITQSQWDQFKKAFVDIKKGKEPHFDFQDDFVRESANTDNDPKQLVGEITQSAIEMFGADMVQNED